MSPKHLFYSLLVSLVFFGCNPDPVQFIPDTFSPYVNGFFQEAQARGYDLQLEDYQISVVFRENINPDGRIGECSSGSRLSIRIDPDYWNRASEAKRRWLIFHEMGHCILDRPHRSGADERGLCYSIMNDNGEVSCELNLNSDLWWNYLVNEMFDDTLTPADAWPNVPYVQNLPPESELVWEQRDTVMDYSFGLPGFSLETLAGNGFSITLEKAEDGGRESFGIGIGIGGLTVQYCNCQVASFKVRGRDNQSLFIGNLKVEWPARIQVQRFGDDIHLYLNDVYLFTTDASEIGDGDDLRVLDRSRQEVPTETMSLEVWAW
jgi:hypothetical protein